jgi:thioredoxin 1
MAGNILEITDSNFQEKVLKASGPVLVDFWAPWCGPCIAIGPTLEALADEYKGKVTIGKMNVDENNNIPASYGVRSIPYLALFKNGQVVDQVLGNVPKAQLAQLLDRAST